MTERHRDRESELWRTRENRNGGREGKGNHIGEWEDREEKENSGERMGRRGMWREERGQSR